MFLKTDDGHIEVANGVGQLFIEKIVETLAVSATALVQRQSLPSDSAKPNSSVNSLVSEMFSV